MMKNFFKRIYSILLKIILLPCRLMPINNKRIAFIGLTGGETYEYCDNLKYLCEYLQKQEVQGLEFIWLVSQPEKYVDVEGSNIHFYKHYTLGAFAKLLTSKVVISSGAYLPWFAFRKSQYVVDTWHGGGAYKKIENDKAGANFLTKRRAKFLANNIDLFLSSCQKATDYLIRGAFTYQGEVLNSGLPRNDFLVKGEVAIARDKVQKYFNLANDDKVLLYAPTYRESSEKITFDSDALLQQLSTTGENWRILTHVHRYESEQASIIIKGNVATDASHYPDIQELLCATDLLVTDYSSIIWDYSLLMRPCCLYAPDLEEYLATTGFYVDIHKWPFPLLSSWEDLNAFVTNYNILGIRENIRAHQDYMGSFENGNACADVAERILEVCKQ
jgi:Putative glycosyl/glycerophosphate transferases involved in teichoic acid biosynthesis TagF/TagB/EpsJ/RodC